MYDTCLSLSPAINSIMAQFDISPYRWPGWALAAITTAVGAISLIGFVETRSLPQVKAFCPSISCLKMETKLRSKGKNSNYAVSYPFTFNTTLAIYSR